MGIILLTFDGDLQVLAQGGGAKIYQYFLHNLDYLLFLTSLLDAHLHLVFFTDEASWDAYREKGTTYLLGQLESVEQGC